MSTLTVALAKKHGAAIRKDSKGWYVERVRGNLIDGRGPRFRTRTRAVAEVILSRLQHGERVPAEVADEARKELANG